MPKAKIPFGPTYDEMLNPNHQDKAVRKAAEKALKTDVARISTAFKVSTGSGSR